MGDAFSFHGSLTLGTGTVSCILGLPGLISPAGLVEEATVWGSGYIEPVIEAGWGWLQTSLDAENLS